LLHAVEDRVEILPAEVERGMVRPPNPKLASGDPSGSRRAMTILPSACRTGRQLGRPPKASA